METRAPGEVQVLASPSPVAQSELLITVEGFPGSQALQIPPVHCGPVGNYKANEILPPPIVGPSTIMMSPAALVTRSAHFKAAEMFLFWSCALFIGTQVFPSCLKSEQVPTFACCRQPKKATYINEVLAAIFAWSAIAITHALKKLIRRKNVQQHRQTLEEVGRDH